jgi:thiamine biosynthesis protein ThiC
MRNAAESEGLDPVTLCAGVADGSIVITRNTQRTIAPLVIGAATRIKINANIGCVSP